MLLKKLTLTGFKSFCDKTSLEFDAGITCVVGPNGCGKSNIVDAIKWVVGEQSPRSLRGRNMIDMIFNGSSTRKSSGLCQVDLHFDNADRRLPTDDTEVTVSRRLYRSGESEYLVNNQAVRLRDIRELFMDTGIGVGAYSIIEQGRVDVLLQANPTERRAIFEEAAGISRFKARRKEAIRKLDRAQQNLLRVEDIVQEVERRLRSIKYQAGKARNYQAHTQRMRELQASYSLAEYHRLTRRIADSEGRIDSANDSISQHRAQLGSAEARTGQLDARIVQLDETITNTENRLHSVRAEMTASTERAEQTRQRIDEQREVLQAAEQRVEAQQGQVETARADISTQEEQLRGVSQELQNQQTQLDELTARDQKAAEQQTDNGAATEEVRAEVIELMRSTSLINNELAGLEQHRKNLDERTGQLSERRREIARRIAESETQRKNLQESGEEIAQKLRAESDRLHENQQRSESLDAERSKLTNHLAETKEQRSATESRQHLLLDLDRKLEGVGAGVREILQRCGKQDRPEFTYVRGLIGELFEADVNHAAAVEAALGELDQALLISDSGALLDDAEKMARLPGRVNALCLDRIPPSVSSPDLSAQEGFIACLIDLVRYPEELELLARHLLGRTILTESLAAAESMRHLAPACRFVTSRGEVMEPDGRVSLGPAGTRAGLVSRKSELRLLSTQLESLDAAIAELDRRLSRASAQFAELSRTQHGIRAEISNIQHQRIQTEARIDNLQASIERLQQEEPLLAGEADSIRAQLEHIAARRGEYDDKLAALNERTAQAQRRADELLTQADSLKRNRTDLTERLTEQRVRAGQLTEKRQAFSNRLNALRVALKQAELAADQAHAEADACRERIAEGRKTLAEAERALQEFDRQEKNLTQEALGHRGQREKARAEVEELSARIKVIRGDLERAENEQHELQLKNQEGRVRRDELIARVQQELDMDLAEIYARYEHTERDWTEVEREIAELKKKIDRLGNVNLDAIAEQRELEERDNFLKTQRDDLVDSRKQLESLIARLDRDCRERFQTTFDATRKHFQGLFRRLFGGGKADIILEDPEDVLESGIEIIAQPPGKELLQISLMSGGEKSLTAIALLLAVFKSRPAPFAVLDEVDAALDEANNERFNHIVTEFLADSQFIIITHSKRTMSIADKLYGVTMQEAGISTLVSVKFEDETSTGQAVA